MSVLKDISGMTFGKLTVKSFSEIKNGKAYWLCSCDCGTEKVIVGTSLRKGTTKSCGCLMVEVAKTHGKCGTKTYEIWKTMVQRCTNPNNKRYPRYGGRGITVSESWRDYANFLRDMGEKPDGLSIDRIDNDGPYCKENCRWADDFTQARNTSKNRYIEFAGERLCLSQWAARIGINKRSLIARLASQMPLEKALQPPAPRYQRRNQIASIR